MAVRGRGASSNPANRFEKRGVAPDPEGADPDAPLPRTRVLKDVSRSILTQSESPDLGPFLTLNPYRGCEHGCAYCYARPTHEYLGFSAGLDFETKILVKEDAPELLAKELSKPSWKPRTI